MLLTASQRQLAHSLTVGSILRRSSRCCLCLWRLPHLRTAWRCSAASSPDKEKQREFRSAHELFASLCSSLPTHSRFPSLKQLRQRDHFSAHTHPQRCALPLTLQRGETRNGAQNGELSPHFNFPMCVNSAPTCTNSANQRASLCTRTARRPCKGRFPTIQNASKVTLEVLTTCCNRYPTKTETIKQHGSQSFQNGSLYYFL